MEPEHIPLETEKHLPTTKFLSSMFVSATERRPKCQVAVLTNNAHRAHRYVCMVCLPTFIIHLPHNQPNVGVYIYIYTPNMDPMGLFIYFMPLNFFQPFVMQYLSQYD